MLQGRVVCCIVLQGVGILIDAGRRSRCVAGCCGVLQGVAGCCRVLQGVAGCCRVLQGVEGCFRVLQETRGDRGYLAVCGVLQSHAVL